MINNLFSIFDPSIYLTPISWISILIPIFIVIKFKIKSNSKFSTLIKTIHSKIANEIKTLSLPSYNKGIQIIITCLLLILIIINLIAITPFTPTPTAQIIISFPIATTYWLSIIIYGWIKKTKKIIIHLVPTGTPYPLINFIVIIEITRNLIRPLTLSIRLSANITAGHLLISLLGNFSLSSQNNFISSNVVFILLSILELAVAIIQAYVFIVLLTLYSTEIN